MLHYSTDCHSGCSGLRLSRIIRLRLGFRVTAGGAGTLPVALSHTASGTGTAQCSATDSGVVHSAIAIQLDVTVDVVSLALPVAVGMMTWSLSPWLAATGSDSDMPVIVTEYSSDSES